MNCIVIFRVQIVATEVASLQAAAFTKVPKMTSPSTAAADGDGGGAKATDLWVNVNGVATRGLCWGRPIDENAAGPGRLVLCVCGNPGVTEFYERFLQEVYRALNVPVWVVSHAGTNISHHTKTFFKIFFTSSFSVLMCVLHEVFRGLSTRTL